MLHSLTVKLSRTNLTWFWTEITYGLYESLWKQSKTPQKNLICSLADKLLGSLQSGHRLPSPPMHSYSSRGFVVCRGQTTVWFFPLFLFSTPFDGLILMCTHWGPHFHITATVNEGFSCIRQYWCCGAGLVSKLLHKHEELSLNPQHPGENRPTSVVPELRGRDGGPRQIPGIL